MVTCTPPLRCRRSGLRPRPSALGFTLTELVVTIVIVAILAAIAVPRFINMATDARIAALKGAMGAIASAQDLAYAKCYLTPGCDDTMSQSGVVAGPDGQFKSMVYGYPSGAINNPSYYGINEWVQMDGFIPVQVTVPGIGYQSAEFRLIGAPDLAQCKATYIEHDGPAISTFITMTTSGC